MMWGRALGTALLLRLVPAAAVGAFVTLAGAPAVAQSAADKATARQLAVQGIKVYEDGKYSEALDKLERAQTLYDAPVHLLYIARCQHKLGMLVESAETYRRMVRDEYIRIARKLVATGMDPETGALLTDLPRLFPGCASLLEKEPVELRVVADQKLTGE